MSNEKINKMPSRGDLITSTDKHPHSPNAVIGTVTSVQGGIVSIATTCSDTDRIYWRSADGLYNPFYEVKNN